MLSPAASQADRASQPDGVFLSACCHIRNPLKKEKYPTFCVPQLLTSPNLHLICPPPHPPKKKCQSEFPVTHGLSLETLLRSPTVPFQGPVQGQGEKEGVKLNKEDYYFLFVS